MNWDVTLSALFLIFLCVFFYGIGLVRGVRKHQKESAEWFIKNYDRFHGRIQKEEENEGNEC